MTNYKVYLIATLLFATPLLLYLYLNVNVDVVGSYGDEITSKKQKPFYLTAIAIPVILYWLNTISQFIGKVINSFPTSMATTLRPPKLYFQFPRVAWLRVIPWNLVALIVVYITLIFYQYKLREMLLFA